MSTADSEQPQRGKNDHKVTQNDYTEMPNDQIETQTAVNRCKITTKTPKITTIIQKQLDSKQLQKHAK